MQRPSPPGRGVLLARRQHKQRKENTHGVLAFDQGLVCILVRFAFRRAPAASPGGGADYPGGLSLAHELYRARPFPPRGPEASARQGRQGRRGGVPSATAPAGPPGHFGGAADSWRVGLTLADWWAGSQLPSHPDPNWRQHTCPDSRATTVAISGNSYLPVELLPPPAEGVADWPRVPAEPGANSSPAYSPPWCRTASASAKQGRTTRAMTSMHQPIWMEPFLRAIVNPDVTLPM